LSNIPLHLVAHIWQAAIPIPSQPQHQRGPLSQIYDRALERELYLNSLRATGNSRLSSRKLLYEQINILTFV